MREAAKVEALARKLARIANPRANLDSLVYQGEPVRVQLGRGWGYMPPSGEGKPLWVAFVHVAREILSDDGEAAESAPHGAVGNHSLSHYRSHYTT